MAGEASVYQQDQPPGVPSLEMTGERTLPEVPQENYWYQRHLVVYEWAATRAAGKRVIDMACGEGYGTDVLARTAESAIGVDANPEAYEHARLKYRGPNLRFACELVEEFVAPADVVVFLQTVEHVREPAAALAHFGDLVRASNGEVFVSTPNVHTLAAPGEAQSANPWHVKEYSPAEFRELLLPFFPRIELFGLFPAGRIRLPWWIAGATGNGFRLAKGRSDLVGRLRQRIGQSVTTSDFRIGPARDVDALEGTLDLIAVCRTS